jgi:predicted nucleotidyltransferase
MKNTDTKEKILELLFKFPNKNFHIREISRTLKISPPSIAKAIKELLKENLIETEKNFFLWVKANWRNQDFINLKRIHNIKSIYNSGLFRYLDEKFPLITITLFGSYCRGEDNENSDIDIAIIQTKETGLELEKFEKILGKNIHIEFIDMDKINKELKSSIVSGVILKGYIKL